MSQTARSGLVILVAIVTVFALSLFAEGAQPPAIERPAPPQPGAQPAIVTDDANAAQTRQRLYGILDRYPPNVGRVLRLDPTLLGNQAYLSSYPQLASFIQQNPQVAHNPAYYLERYAAQFEIQQPEDPRREAIRLWRSAIQGLGVMTIFFVVAFSVVGLLKYLVEYRRWHRMSKVHSEVQNKILDRFGSNQELLAYLDTPSGRRLLDAAPAAPGNAAPVAAPFSRILLSVQAGIILAALAVGFLFVSRSAIEEVQPLLVGAAIIGFALGLGFVLSAAASYFLSRRMGLLQAPAAPTTSHVV